MKYIFALSFVFFAKIASAQQLYFIYIQTDNKQPFYIKIDNKLLSSSASGYLVVPKLVEGEHSFQLGFPKDQWELQQFTINVSGNDAGYLLKNFKEKGWGLYNIQTMQTTMSGTKPAPTKKQVDSDEEFANALSGAANTKVAVAKPKQASGAITKLTSGFKENDYIATYLVDNNGKKDTVKLAIVGNVPTPKKVEPIVNEEIAVAKEEVTPEKKVETAAPVVVKQETTAPAVKQVEVTPAKKEDKPEVSFNSDCKAKAEQDDFIKLRKKMAAQDNDEEMISAAVKVFKTKCFTVEQVKNLSILLLSDKGKYSFFDAVYPYTLDTNNFKQLAAELKDAYYINRFNAMLKN
jgi:Domain of unknown function (DUF4476)